MFKRAWLVLLIIALVCWASYRFLQPVPPKTLTMTTGMEGGSFVIFGERYREILARDGINLKLLSSTGAVDNLRRLQDESQSVDAGFVQDGMGKAEEAPNLESLGSIFYTPLWIFYRGDETLDDLSQLQGKRISIGPEGSGVRKISLDLLKAAGVSVPPTVLHEYPSMEAGRALLAGKVDAVMTQRPETLGPDDPVAFALRLMSVGGFRHIPLVDGEGRPVGILSVKDIVDFLVEHFPQAVLNIPPEPGRHAERPATIRPASRPNFGRPPCGSAIWSRPVSFSVPPQATTWSSGEGMITATAGLTSMSWSISSAGTRATSCGCVNSLRRTTRRCPSAIWPWPPPNPNSWRIMARRTRS